MRVVLLTNIPAPYTVDLIYFMQSNLMQYDIHVIYTSKNEDNREWNVDEEKLVNTVILNSKVLRVKTGIDYRYIHLPADIGRQLSKLKPDVVIAWEYNLAAIQALLWCKTHGRKYINLTEGTLISERNLWWIQKLTRRLIIGNADAFLVSGIKAKEKVLYWGAEEKKIFTGYLTVDTSKYRGIKRAPVSGRILYVGSMAKRKGLDLLLDALVHVHEDFQLHIVGNGTDEQIAELKAKAKENQMEEKIVFCGFQQGSALVDAYRQAAVFVLPTREDCFGLVLLEAMCAGVPIVASSYADGAFDVIEEGRTGYIADPFSPVEFGCAIDSVLREGTLSEPTQQQLNKFSFESVSSAYADAVEYVLKDTRG